MAINTGQCALAGNSSWKLEDFVGEKFYCLHTLADDNQHTQIREKTLQFSSTLLSPYLLTKHLVTAEKQNKLAGGMNCQTQCLEFNHFVSRDQQALFLY